MTLKYTLRFKALLMVGIASLGLKALAEELPSIPNLCAGALNQLSEYRVDGIYGSPLESAWHPAAFYKLIHRMRELQVIEQEFRDVAEDWTFEFVTLSGGRIVAFVGHKKNREAACPGPNAFYVMKKD